jgi:DNA-binding NarL/FixJ family response regulator
VRGATTSWDQWSAAAHSRVTDYRPLTLDRQSLVRAATEAQRELAAATEAASHAMARAYALSQQLERALETLARSDAPASTPEPTDGKPWARLSPREREVLALVAEGHSNKAIAEALFVSPNTVKTHVAALLTKLEVDTRVQLAALAVRHANWPEAA